MISLIGWWYGSGFLIRLKSLGGAMSRMADKFSIGLLIKTLFNPFRQIDAGAQGKGISEKFQAFLSRLISRFVGFVARTILIIAGVIVLIAQALGSFVMIIFHLAVPLLPVVGIVMMVIGWVPEVSLW